MHPTTYYDFARAKMDDELRAAEQRRLRKLAKESRPARSADQSIVGRVWNLITGFSPSEPAVTGSAS
jgi:hypothetical protein